MELTFNTGTRGLIRIYRGTALIAEICQLGGGLWGLIAGGAVIATGTPAKMRRAAVARFCTCSDCRGGAQ